MNDKLNNQDIEVITIGLRYCVSIVHKYVNGIAPSDDDVYFLKELGKLVKSVL